jgi:hypothetical protein
MPVRTARIVRVTSLAVALAAVVAFVSGGAGASVTADRSLLHLGDSLSVGTQPFLAHELPRYRIQGYRAVGLRSEQAATRIARARALPHVLVVSAGTNDDPREVTAFSHSVEEVLAVAGRGRCVVWPTIARPAVQGFTYFGINRVLSRTAARRSNLVLVDWAGMVRRHPVWLGADRVHASSAGYRARAHAIARAVTRRCAS